ncbi:MAG: prepilin peptidase [Candidatus Buchananbacteria bacterium]
MEIPFYIFLFIFGSLIGSFLNVIILRTKNNENIVWGRSYCPKCKKKLASFDLIPIISFLFLGGKCRYCRNKISWQYPAVEFITAILFLLAGIIWLDQAGDFLLLLRNLIFIAFAILIFVYDYRWQIIPDRFSIPAIILILILNLFLGVPILTLLIGALIAGGFFLFQFVISKGRWIGGGDIRLGILMGVLLGWERTLLALLIAYVGGAVISIFLIIFLKKKMNSQVAFGTFLLVATLVAVFWGDNLINFYLGNIF